MTSEKAAPCRHPGAPPESVVEKVSNVLVSLSEDSAYLATKGLTAEEYRSALPAAIQKLRGSRAAGNANRRQFLVGLFERMLQSGHISKIESPRYGDDTVYRLSIDGFGEVAVIQKGCPDGAHSSVRWSAPEWAKETYLWWICDSLTLEPGEHVSKGVNRLRQRFFSEAPDSVDGVIFHNELCGTSNRPCPKIDRALLIDGILVPPPCVYIMPEHCKDGAEWNWDGARERLFPKILLAMFDISASDAPAYVGFVGFQKRGGTLRTTIASPFGAGRSTNFRS
jgi:hypothetical protein